MRRGSSPPRAITGLCPKAVAPQAPSRAGLGTAAPWSSFRLHRVPPTPLICFFRALRRAQFTGSAPRPEAFGAGSSAPIPLFECVFCLYRPLCFFVFFSAVRPLRRRSFPFPPPSPFFVRPSSPLPRADVVARFGLRPPRPRPPIPSLRSTPVPIPPPHRPSHLLCRSFKTPPVGVLRITFLGPVRTSAAACFARVSARPPSRNAASATDAFFDAALRRRTCALAHLRPRSEAFLLPARFPHRPAGVITTAFSRPRAVFAPSRLHLRPSPGRLHATATASAGPTARRRASRTRNLWRSHDPFVCVVTLRNPPNSPDRFSRPASTALWPTLAARPTALASSLRPLHAVFPIHFLRHPSLVFVSFAPRPTRQASSAPSHRPPSLFCPCIEAPHQRNFSAATETSASCRFRSATTGAKRPDEKGLPRPQPAGPRADVPTGSRTSPSFLFPFRTLPHSLLFLLCRRSPPAASFRRSLLPFRPAAIGSAHPLARSA